MAAASNASLDSAVMFMRLVAVSQEAAPLLYTGLCLDLGFILGHHKVAERHFSGSDGHFGPTGGARRSTRGTGTCL